MHAANSENEALAAVSATQTSALETAWSKRMAGFFSSALKGHHVIAQGNALGTGHHGSMPCKGFIGRPPEMEPFQGMTAGTSTTQGVALGYLIVPFQGGGNPPTRFTTPFLA